MMVVNKRSMTLWRRVTVDDCPHHARGLISNKSGANMGVLRSAIHTACFVDTFTLHVLWSPISRPTALDQDAAPAEL